MFTSVFGISIKYEAWNHQDSLPVYIAGSYDFHTVYPLCWIILWTVRFRNHAVILSEEIKN